MFNAWAKDNKVPTFGYDANSDAVAAIAEGYGGTISQHADVQAYLTLSVLRNALDGVDIDTGIGTPDDAGNCLTEGEDYRYSSEEVADKLSSGSYRKHCKYQAIPSCLDSCLRPAGWILCYKPWLSL